MPSELFLDLYKFSGHETILEVHTSKPLYSEPLMKRGKYYFHENIVNLHKQDHRKYDLVVICINQDLSPVLKKSLSKFLHKVDCFLLISQNKLSFHHICDFFEFKRYKYKEGLSLFELRSVIPKKKNILLTFFHDVRQPTLIEPISGDFPYVMGRSARIQGKRNFLKIISVLFEIIFVRFLKVKFIFPGYIVLQNCK